MEYCGDELRHGLAGREDAVAFEFLDKGAAAKRVRSEPTSGNRGGFSLTMDETYLENDPLSFQILQSLRRVALGSLVEGQRRGLQFLDGDLSFVNPGAFDQSFELLRLWCFRGKVEFVPFSSTKQEMFACKRFSGKGSFGEELGLKSKVIVSGS